MSLLTRLRYFTRPSFGAVLALAAAAVLTALTLFDWDDSGIGLRYHLDADIYRLGATALLENSGLYTQLYAAENATLPFTYPPFAAILFVPLTWVSTAAGGAALTLLSVVLLWLAIAIVARAAGRLDRAQAMVVACWLLPVALLFEPVRETLNFGQINVVLMVLVLADTLIERGPRGERFRGIGVGLAAAIKLTPAVFFIYFLVARKWRAAAVSALTGIVATLLAALVAPRDSWEYWWQTLSDTGRIGASDYATNQSWMGVLARILGPEHAAVQPIWLACVVLTLLAIVAALLRLRGKITADAVFMVLLTSLIARLCSPVSWSHHWVWMVPLAVALGAMALRAADNPDKADSRIAASLTVLVTSAALVQPHFLLPNANGQEQLWPWWAHLAGNSYVLVAVVLILVALLLPEIRRSRATARTTVAVSTALSAALIVLGVVYLVDATVSLAT